MSSIVGELLVEAQRHRGAADSGSNATAPAGCSHLLRERPQPPDYEAALLKEAAAYENSPKFRHKIAELRGERRIEPAIERLLGVLVQQGTSVLDLGAGAGNVARMAKARAGKGARVSGVELVPGWVRAATSVVPDVDFHQGDLTAARLNATFDLILMLDSMEHIPPFRRPQLWRTLRTHAAPGATLYMHLPTTHKQQRTMSLQRLEAESQRRGGAAAQHELAELLRECQAFDQRRQQRGAPRRQQRQRDVLLASLCRQQYFEESVPLSLLLQQAACSGFGLVEMEHLDSRWVDAKISQDIPGTYRRRMERAPFVALTFRRQPLVELWGETV